MGIFDGCLIASDIDGTLLASGRINPKNFEKIRYFISEGGKFSLASGRTIGGMTPIWPMVEDIELSPCALGNGCTIYDYKKNEVVESVTLPSGADLAVRAVMKEMPEVGIQVHCEGTVYVLKRTQEVDDHINYEQFPSKDASIDDILHIKWNKLNYFAESIEHREKISKITSRFADMCEFVDTGAIIDGRLRYFHEQLPKNASKASLLTRLCEILNIKKGGLFAIGDYYNDVSMLKAADISAATAEAPDDVKACADFVSCGVNEGAVADFIDYLEQRLKNE